MKYLLNDTNIYIQCCLLQLEGDDHNVLKKLLSLVEQNKLILILPEVVEIEFDKALQDTFEKIKNQIGVHKEAINKDVALDSKIKKDLILKLTELSVEREKYKSEVRRTIDRIFNHKNTHRIKLNTSAMENAYRNFLSGEKPYSSEEKGQIQPDCLLIEAAREYLHKMSDYDFLFCSSNTRDFAENPKVKEAHYQIANDIKLGFKNLSYYTTLFQCLNDNFQTKYPKEVIERATEEFYQTPVHSHTLTHTGLTIDPRYANSSLILGPASTSMMSFGSANDQGLNVNPNANIHYSQGVVVPNMNVIPANMINPNVNLGAVSPASSLKVDTSGIVTPTTVTPTGIKK